MYTVNLLRESLAYRQIKQCRATEDCSIDMPKIKWCYFICFTFKLYILGLFASILWNIHYYPQQRVLLQQIPSPLMASQHHPTFKTIFKMSKSNKCKVHILNKYINVHNLKTDSEWNSFLWVFLLKHISLFCAKTYIFYIS